MYNSGPDWCDYKLCSTPPNWDSGLDIWRLYYYLFVHVGGALH